MVSAALCFVARLVTLKRFRAAGKALDGLATYTRRVLDLVAWGTRALMARLCALVVPAGQLLTARVLTRRTGVGLPATKSVCGLATRTLSWGDHLRTLRARSWVALVRARVGAANAALPSTRRPACVWA
jgi:hypothetical protein